MNSLYTHKKAAAK